jgi:2'-5' RNA ligase
VRLFVAAYPSAEAIDDLSALVARMAVGRSQAPGQSVRLAPPERWHLTLAFIGELEEHREPAARDAVAAAAEDWRTAGHPAPVLRLGGGGRFGRGRFTVLWTGLRGDVPGLTTLAGGVRRRLRGARLPQDHKPFRAHLSLARPGDRLPPPVLAADLATIAEYEGPQWTIDRVELVRSQLGPQPRHDRIGAWPIQPT